MQKLNLSNNKQKGAALIIFAVILVLAAMAYMIKMFDPVALQALRNDKNAQFLAQAKQALISHSVSRAAALERPGDMPTPDYFPANELPLLNYDGNSETGCVEVDALNLPKIPLNLIVTGNISCLGRLPWRTIGLAIPTPSEADPSGNMPWYGVSANLVEPICLADLNPDILNLVNNPPPAPLDCSGLTLPYPWLTVIDSAGHILSRQVAAVLMLPVAILAGQSRPTAPLGDVSNYLDAVTVPAGCVGDCVPPGTYSNADFDNIFVIPPPFTASNTANDRLVYITIQELMTAVERRVTQEAAVQLKRYYANSNAIAANRFYPYAANLGVPDNACVEGSSAGLLPTLVGCESNSDCKSSFIKTPTVSFTFACPGNYTVSTGACTFLGKTCECKGAGSCTRNPTSKNNSCLSSLNRRIFECDSFGRCESNVGGEYTYTYAAPVPDNTIATGSCAVSGSNTIFCTGPGKFSVTNCSHPNKALATLPAWFTDNNWQEHIYYAISNNCSAASTGCGAADLTVGTRTGVHAVVISSGVTLPATEALALSQVRPSSDPKNYLDSLMNTDGGTVTDPANIIFDATSKMKANDYNDQSLIVAPQ